MALWTPAEITTALWLDAADSGTVTLDSGKATQWDDKSGNARHATPASAGTGAVPLSASINGLNTLSFDGTANQRMVCNRPFPGVGSFFYVQKTTDPTYLIFNSGAGRFSTIAQSGSGSAVSGGYGTPVYYLEGNLQTWDTRDQVYLSLHNRVSVVEHIGCSLASSWGSLLGICNYDHSADFLFNGEIGEIIGISGEIDLESRQKIEGYLAWKWGLESNLPVGHPYDSMPPYADVPAASLTLTALAPTINQALVPAASLTLTTQAPTINQSFVPAASLTLTALAPRYGHSYNVPAAALTLTAQAPTFSLTADIPAAALTLTAKVPVLTLAPSNNQVMRSVFRAYLVTPGYADLELPISSFQARLRLTTANYLAIVVPNPLPYIDAITERSAGRVVIKSGFALADGTEVLEKLTSGVFNSFRYDLGPFSGSATIVAYDYRGIPAS